MLATGQTSSKGYTTINATHLETEPICRTRHHWYELDLRLPFWRYFGMMAEQPHSFLLDSALESPTLGRYSFLGANPTLVFRAKRRSQAAPDEPAEIIVEHHRSPWGDRLAEPERERFHAEPLGALRQWMERFHVDPDSYRDDRVPFLSGAVGYFGYEAAYFIERLPDTGQDDLGLPDLYLMFFDELLVHCHQTDCSYLSVLQRDADSPFVLHRHAQTRNEWKRRIAAFERQQAETQPADPAPSRPQPPMAIHQPFDAEEYCQLVETVREHIFAGDVFEVCTTHRLDVAMPCSAWQVYEELRRINPAPFACFLNLPEAQIVSSSPERFLRMTRDRWIESRPIKGTRPRRGDANVDARARQELAESEKDCAENVMIVDLVRNDLGRVCKFGSIEVAELMAIEEYATLFQMVSTIRGQLRDAFDGIDLIRACFPGGSMTGAPKIEAMKIIDRLEPVKRGVYSGAIGYLDFSGPLDLNIVIRTLVVKDGRGYFNVGGAIVADSVPEEEYRETMDKARAMVVALQNVS